MSDASPASAQPNTPAAPLSIHQAAAMLDSQAAAAQATPAQPGPAETAAQTETDTSLEAAPETVEDGAPESEEDSPQETEAEDGEKSDPNGLVVEYDGEEILVEDAIKSHLRFRDLQARVTRKEQALAEERRALDAQRQTVEQTVAETTKQVAAREAELERTRATLEAEGLRYRQGLEAIEAQANAVAAEWAKVDWIKLAEEDPIGWPKTRAQFDAFNQQRQAVVAEKAEMDRKASEQYREGVRKAKATLHEHITTKHPEFVDPAKGNQLWNDMVATLRSVGLNDDLIKAAVGMSDDPRYRVLDPPNLDLVVKATLYDRLMKETAAVSQPAADAKPGELPRMRIVKGNAPRPRPEAVERGRIGGVQSAFQARPTMENALAVLEARQAYRSRRQG